MRSDPGLSRRLVLSTSFSILLVMAGCSGGSGGGDAAGSDPATKALTPVAASEFEDMTGEAAVTITAKDNSFSPQYVTVSPGTKVTFENRGRTAHNVIPVETDAFEKIPTDALQPGDSATLVLADQGDYAYYCSLHGTPDKGMNGRISVAAE